MEGFLNKHEIALVKTRFTEKRNTSNLQAIRDKFTGEKRNQLCGFLGELAFAKHLGIYPRSILQDDYLAKLAKFDFMIRGKSFEIKSIDGAKCNYLMVNHEQVKILNDTADYYGLVEINGPITDKSDVNYRLVGYIPGNELITHNNLSDSPVLCPNGHAYIKHKDELKPFTRRFLQEIKEGTQNGFTESDTRKPKTLNKRDAFPQSTKGVY